jgi:hypothetical protein
MRYAGVCPIEFLVGGECLGCHSDLSRLRLAFKVPFVALTAADNQRQATTARLPVKLMQQDVLLEKMKNGNPHPGRARPYPLTLLSKNLADCLSAGRDRNEWRT